MTTKKDSQTFWHQTFCRWPLLTPQHFDTLTFWRRDILTPWYFAGETFCHQDIVSQRHFATQTLCCQDILRLLKKKTFCYPRPIAISPWNCSDCFTCYIEWKLGHPVTERVLHYIKLLEFAYKSSSGWDPQSSGLSSLKGDAKPGGGGWRRTASPSCPSSWLAGSYCKPEG